MFAPDSAYINPSEREELWQGVSLHIFDRDEILASHAVVDSIAADFATAATGMKWHLQHMLGDSQETKDAKTLMLKTLERFDNLTKAEPNE